MTTHLRCIQILFRFADSLTQLLGVFFSFIQPLPARLDLAAAKRAWERWACFIGRSAGPVLSGMRRPAFRPDPHGTATAAGNMPPHWPSSAGAHPEQSPATRDECKGLQRSAICSYNAGGATLWNRPASPGIVGDVADDN